VGRCAAIPPPAVKEGNGARIIEIGIVFPARSNEARAPTCSHYGPLIDRAASIAPSSHSFDPEEGPIRLSPGLFRADRDEWVACYAPRPTGGGSFARKNSGSSSAAAVCSNEHFITAALGEAVRRAASRPQNAHWRASTAGRIINRSRSGARRSSGAGRPCGTGRAWWTLRAGRACFSPRTRRACRAWITFFALRPQLTAANETEHYCH
jgi:hypothetical protein